MPRNGSDIYYIPPGTEGFPDTTIESAKYNTYIHDVETDLNRPRPISSGGTGANDADEALANLGAEKSSQRVDNYDSHVFFPGSFYSIIGATGAPPTPSGQTATQAFVGWVVSSDPPATPPANQNVVVHARNQNDITVPGRVYVREKKAGMWGKWSTEVATIIASDTPPPDVTKNTLWWNSTNGLLYIRYGDPDSEQWVLASPLPKPPEVPDARAIVADTPPEGVQDSTLWWNNTDGLLYILYADADSQQWVLASPLPRSDVTRAGIAAAPIDALSYNGIQINGGFEISQELGTTGRTTNGYVCDGWLLSKVGTSAMTVKQNATSIVPGFSCFLDLQVTTAQASLGVADVVQVYHQIEGLRIARLAWGTLNAQAITVGFWCQHHRTGTYSLTIQNSAATSSYSTTYTQVTADMAEYKTITIPGPVSGTWNVTSATGMSIIFAVAAGTDLIAPFANTWQPASYAAAPGQTNAVADTSDKFRIAGVVVLPGNDKPTAAQSANIMRPYAQELETCKRYWQTVTAIVDTPAAYQSWAFPVEFRANPNVTGGGAGFVFNSPNTKMANFSQTARAAQTLLLNARL